MSARPVVDLDVALYAAEEHVLKVGSLLWIGISHRECAGRLIGARVTQWATVASIPMAATQHPLNKLAARNYFLGMPEMRMSRSSLIFGGGPHDRQAAITGSS